MGQSNSIKTVENDYTNPLATDRLEELVSPWLIDIYRDDISVVMSYPFSSPMFLFIETIKNTYLLKKYLVEPDNFHFITIDFRVDPIADPYELEKLIIHKLSQHKLCDDHNADLQDLMQTLPKKIVIAAFGCKKLIDYNRLEVLQWLINISEYTDMRSVLFFDGNLFSEKAKILFSSTDNFHPHVHIHSLYSIDDCRHFVNHLALRWQFEITDQERDQIITLCGQSLTLIKEVVRFYTQTKQVTVNKLLSQEEINLCLYSYFHSFNEEEKQVLYQICQGSSQFDQKYTESLHYLQLVGIISQHDQTYNLNLPLLKEYILKNHSSGKQLSLRADGSIILEDILINPYFSTREQLIIRKLLQQKGKLITREELAHLLWPINTADHYSDWAIDSHISRIRKKLITLGINKNALTVKKGKGVLFR